MPGYDVTTRAELMEEPTTISIAATKAILACGPDSQFRVKGDGSPVTRADKAAEAVICEKLAQVAPACPIVSEETAEGERPIAGAKFFVVDPLDGTRGIY